MIASSEKNKSAALSFRAKRSVAEKSNRFLHFAPTSRDFSRNDRSGFSIAEILIALGILTVALVFIAGVFPVGIHFTQKNMDTTTAAIVANEAFAKTRLLADQVIADANGNPFMDDLEFDAQCIDWLTVVNDDLISSNQYTWDSNFFLYPSDSTIEFDDKKYSWYAIYRLTSEIPDANSPQIRDVQVTIFVCHRTGGNLNYLVPDTNGVSVGDDEYGQLKSDETWVLPRPVKVEVDRVSGVDNELQISDSGEKTLINDGDHIVCDRTGRIYRVLERYADTDDIILLDKGYDEMDYKGNQISSRWFVWVVPPGIVAGSGLGRSGTLQLSGKSPCVGIYQKVIRF